MRIAYITSKQYPGVTSVGIHTSALGLCDLFYIEDNKIAIENYDMLVFGAWHNSYMPIIMQFSGKKAILWTSSPGQTSFAEIPILQHIFKLLNKDFIDNIFFGSIECYEMFKDHPKVKYFPYPLAKKLIE